MTRKYLVWVGLALVQSYFLSKSTIDQNKLIDIINLSISFSGIIFAINGVWIAVLFPQIFTKIYNPDEQLKIRKSF